MCPGEARPAEVPVHVDEQNRPIEGTKKMSRIPGDYPSSDEQNRPKPHAGKILPPLFTSVQLKSSTGDSRRILASSILQREASKT